MNLVHWKRIGVKLALIITLSQLALFCGPKFEVTKLSDPFYIFPLELSGDAILNLYQEPMSTDEQRNWVFSNPTQPLNVEWKAEGKIK